MKTINVIFSLDTGVKVHNRRCARSVQIGEITEDVRATALNKGRTAEYDDRMQSAFVEQSVVTLNLEYEIA